MKKSWPSLGSLPATAILVKPVKRPKTPGLRPQIKKQVGRIIHTKNRL